MLPSRELVCMKPSPPHFTQVTGRVWPDSVYIHRRVLASHTLAVPSCEAVANCRQGISTCAGCQAIDMMHFEWPAGKYRCLSVTCHVTMYNTVCRVTDSHAYARPSNPSNIHLLIGNCTYDRAPANVSTQLT